MDEGIKNIQFSTVSVPEPAGVAQLHNHFQNKYDLSDDEAEKLVMSSARSLIDFLDTAKTLLENSDEKISSEQVQMLAHKGKGLFLIMGQDEWAVYVTTLNVTDPDTIGDSIQMVVDQVGQSFSDIIKMR